MKILLYHSHKKTNKKGLAPIYLRLQGSINTMHKELSTSIYVAKHQFNGITVIKHPEQELMNVRLQRLILNR